MPPKPSPKQKAADKQAELEEARQGKAAAQKEQEDAAAWADGAKDNAKARAAEEKEAERRRKAAENAALLAGEEAELSKVVRTGKAAKKTGKDDFALLNDALSKQPKTKAQKDAEIKQKADEERKKKEAENREKKEAIKKAEEEYARKAAAKGVVLNHTDELMVPINNRLDEDELEGTGLDAAVDALTMGLKGTGPTSVFDHPEKRRKALYNAYYESQLVVMKEELPGLKLSQYKERIFELWKRSPENPDNQGK